MATMPGLPMLGHGQVEGLTEKYGMEFQRPRLDETADGGLVSRHEFQLFPLLRRRRIFAEVDRFLLYDFETTDQSVDENVFAYSNEVGGERSLVVYNNRYGDTRGRIRLSTAVAHREDGGERTLVRTALGEGIGLPDNEDGWIVFRDAVADLEYLRSCVELRSEGLYLELGAYRLHCFLDFREVTDDERHPYRQLAAQLDGRGVPSIDEALGQLVLSPLLDPLRRLLDESILHGLSSPDSAEDAGAALLRVAGTEVSAYLEAAAHRAEAEAGHAEIERSILADLENLLAVMEIVRKSGEDGESSAPATSDHFDVLAGPGGWATVLVWILVRRLGELRGGEDALELARSWLNEWYVGSTLADLLIRLGEDREAARRHVLAVDLMLAGVGWEKRSEDPASGLHELVVEVFASPEGQQFLGVHRYDDVLWFHREAFERLAGWFIVTAAVDSITGDVDMSTEVITNLGRAIERLLATAERSGYRVSDLLEAVRPRGDLRRQ